MEYVCVKQNRAYQCDDERLLFHRDVRLKIVPYYAVYGHYVVYCDNSLAVIIRECRYTENQIAYHIRIGCICRKIQPLCNIGAVQQKIYSYRNQQKRINKKILLFHFHHIYKQYVGKQHNNNSNRKCVPNRRQRKPEPGKIQIQRIVNLV